MDEYLNHTVQLNRKSRSNTSSGRKPTANGFIDRLLRSIFVTFLFAMNLALFIYSVNGRLLEAGHFNQAYTVICGGLLVFFIVLMLVFSFSENAQNAICGISTLIVTVMFYSQFALFNTDTFIEEWLKVHAKWLTFIGFIPALWLTGLFFGVIIFFAFRKRLILFFVTLCAVSFGTVYLLSYEMKPAPKEEYTALKEYKSKGALQENNLAYFMLPKLPSYQFFNLVSDTHFKELKDFIIGFYAINNFEIYPNAFVQKSDTMSNLIDIYNQVDYISTSSGDRKYAEMINKWDFEHSSLEILGLEDNRLYTAFKGKKYTTSTYPMPGFNLCYKKDDIFTDRCITKAPKVVKIYDEKSSLDRNVYALLGEWVLSLGSRDLKSVAKMFLDMSAIKGYKIISENRRVSFEGAPYLFNRLITDLAHDDDGMAYMVYVDMPSDIFIYDEFCQLKPRKQWVALKDNSIYSGGIDEKRKAYVEQTKCLFGLLQAYLDKATENGKLAKTDVIVQGVSPLRELAGLPAGKYESFVADRLVSLGIRRHENPQFSLNANICLASDFTKSFIDEKPTCYTIDHMKMTREDAYELKQNLINNSQLRSSRIAILKEDYSDWYEEFKNKNSVMQKESSIAQSKQITAKEVKKADVKSAIEEVKVPEEIVDETVPVENVEVSVEEAVSAPEVKEEQEVPEEIVDETAPVENVEVSVEEAVSTPEVKEEQEVSEEIVDETAPVENVEVSVEEAVSAPEVKEEQEVSEEIVDETAPVENVEVSVEETVSTPEVEIESKVPEKVMETTTEDPAVKENNGSLPDDLFDF